MLLPYKSYVRTDHRPDCPEVVCADMKVIRLACAACNELPVRGIPVQHTVQELVDRQRGIASRQAAEHTPGVAQWVHAHCPARSHIPKGQTPLVCATTSRGCGTVREMPTPVDPGFSPMANGRWPLAGHPWPVVANGSLPRWPVAQDAWPMAGGLRSMAHDPWPTALGPSSIAGSLRPLAHGPQPMELWSHGPLVSDTTQRRRPALRPVPHPAARKPGPLLMSPMARGTCLAANDMRI